MTFDNATVSYTLANDGVAGHGLTLDNGGAANGSFTGAVVAVDSGSHTIAAKLTLADSAGTTFNVVGGSSLTVSGTITGSGANQSLTLTGGGTLTLGNTDSYNGGTTVSDSTLATTANGALGTGPLAVNSAGGSAIVNIGGNESIGGLSSTFRRRLGGRRCRGRKTLTVNPSATATFGGTLGLAAGSAITKTGTRHASASPPPRNSATALH